MRAADAVSVHFFQHVRGGAGKTRQDHVEVIEKNHSILDAGRSGRQFEGAHPFLASQKSIVNPIETRIVSHQGASLRQIGAA
jgi:hypothetical protein